jgi:hypothetical protein
MFSILLYLFKELVHYKDNPLFSINEIQGLTLIGSFDNQHPHTRDFSREYAGVG